VCSVVPAFADLLARQVLWQARAAARTQASWACNDGRKLHYKIFIALILKRKMEQLCSIAAGKGSQLFPFDEGD
jgi:hypothetical protein